MRAAHLGWGAAAAGLALLMAALAWGLAHPAAGAATVVGRPAPDLAIRSLDGTTVSLSSLRGRPVVLNFWASWCAPCREEGPVLVAAASRYGDRVAFVGADIQDSEGAARSFDSELGVSYPSGPVTSGSAASYGVTGPPETFFIDSQGRVTARFTGPLDAGALDRYLGLVGAS